MAVFQSRKFRSSAEANKLGMRYRAAMAKHPFLLFGLPFMSVIVAASFVLTPATAIRYERHDRKVRQLTREEELGVGKAGRRVDIREEYYVSRPLFLPLPGSDNARRRFEPVGWLIHEAWGRLLPLNSQLTQLFVLALADVLVAETRGQRPR